MSALSGKRVYVTRPRHQADNLMKLVEAAGGQAVSIPLLEIYPPASVDAFHTALAQLHDTDWIIFISVNAVTAVSSACAKENINLPLTASIAAIGSKTADACIRSGLRVDVVPHANVNSEGLLAALKSRVTEGQKVVIFAGQTGRGLLEETLSTWGARVSVISSYRREVVMPDLSIEAWSKVEQDALDMSTDAFIVVSSEAILHSLIDWIQTDARIEALCLSAKVIASSERIAETCRDSAYFKTVSAAPSPTDEGVMQLLEHI